MSKIYASLLVSANAGLDRAPIEYSLNGIAPEDQILLDLKASQKSAADFALLVSAHVGVWKQAHSKLATIAQKISPTMEVIDFGRPFSDAYNASSKALLSRVFTGNSLKTKDYVIESLMESGTVLPDECLNELLYSAGKNPLISNNLVQIISPFANNLLRSLKLFPKSLKAAPEDVWAHGSREQRLVFLEQLRANDPQAACDCLMKDAHTFSSADKLAFLGLMSGTLTELDKPFLASLVSDSDEAVARVAVILASRIAGTEQHTAAYLLTAKITSQLEGDFDFPDLINDPLWAVLNVSNITKRVYDQGPAWYALSSALPLEYWEHAGIPIKKLADIVKSHKLSRFLKQGFLDGAINAPEKTSIEFLSLICDDAELQSALNACIKKFGWAQLDQWFINRIQGNPNANNLALLELVKITSSKTRFSKVLSSVLIDESMKSIEAGKFGRKDFPVIAQWFSELPLHLDEQCIGDYQKVIEGISANEKFNLAMPYLSCPLSDYIAICETNLSVRSLFTERG